MASKKKAAKKAVKKTTKTAKKSLKKNPAKKLAPTPKLKKIPATTHMVVFEYTGGADAELDQAASVLLGRRSSGSGFDFDKKTRDIDWDYASRLAADNAAERLHKWWAKEKKNYKGVTATIRVSSY